MTQVTRLVGTQFNNAGLPLLVEIPGDTVALLAGSTTGDTLGTGGAAQIKNPAGVVVDSTGTYAYVCDGGNHKIKKVDLSTGAVTLLAGSGSAASADGTGSGATFNVPTGIVIDSTDTNLYVSESTGNKIRKIVISSGVVTTVAGSGTASSVDGTGTAATFNAPVGLAIDSVDGFLYTADFGGRKIRKINISTTVVTTLAGSGSSGTADGIGTAATFTSPFACALDATNTYLYILDYGGHTLRRLNLSSLAVKTLAGKAGTSGNTNGVGLAARFNGPAGLFLDPAGRIAFVAEQAGHLLRKVDLDTLTVSTFAGSGSGADTDGVGTSAALYGPRGVFWSTVTDKLYVTTYSGHKLRTVS